MATSSSLNHATPTPISILFSPAPTMTTSFLEANFIFSAFSGFRYVFALVAVKP